MMKSMVGLGATLALTALVSGCPFDLSGLIPGEAGCTGDFAVTVGSGTTPEISWDGDAAGLSVTRFPETAERQWTLSMMASPFASPVTYGTVPAGALEAEGEAIPLETGTQYAVTITLGDGAGASCQTFTP